MKLYLVICVKDVTESLCLKIKRGKSLKDNEVFIIWCDKMENSIKRIENDIKIMSNVLVEMKLDKQYETILGFYAEEVLNENGNLHHLKDDFKFKELMNQIKAMVDYEGLYKQEKMSNNNNYENKPFEDD